MSVNILLVTTPFRAADDEVDVPPDQARNLTRLVGLSKDKPPETGEE